MVTIREEFVKGDSDRKGFGKHRLSGFSRHKGAAGKPEVPRGRPQNASDMLLPEYQMISNLS